MKLMFTNSKDTDNFVTRVRLDTRNTKYPVLKYLLPRSEGYKKSVVFHGPSRWEKLPSDLKFLESLDEFELEIK